MIAALHRLFGLGKVNLVDDTGKIQQAQLQLSGAEARDKTPMLLMFGFTSNPPVGSDVATVSLSGERTKVVGLGTNHPPSRQTGTPPGGMKIYDEGGRFVGILNDGNIIMLAPGETLRQLLTEVALTLFNMHTHNTPSGVSSAPNQQMNAAHMTGATRAGGP